MTTSYLFKPLVISLGKISTMNNFLTLLGLEKGVEVKSGMLKGSIPETPLESKIFENPYS